MIFVNREHIQQFVRDQIAEKQTYEDVLNALAGFFAGMREFLPRISTPHHVPPPVSHPVDALIIQWTAIDHIVGNVWLFDPNVLWPDNEKHWKKLARLLLTPSPLTLTNADQFAKNLAQGQHRITGIELQDHRIWISNGCRRIYAAWLLGCNAIPIHVEERETTVNA